MLINELIPLNGLKIAQINCRGLETGDERQHNKTQNTKHNIIDVGSWT
jgi:hypothetical protein